VRKQLLALSLCLALFVCAAGPAYAAEEAESSVPQIYIDGALYENPYTTVINEVTYISLVNVIQLMRPQASIVWEDGGPKARDEGLELSARPGDLYLYANGRYLYIPGRVQTATAPDGTLATLVPVRVLAKALGASVDWDGTVQITSEGEALVPGDEFYDQDAIYLLSHIIYSESGNQPLEGKIAVGNVLLNRVNHPSFPSTLYDVVYQPGQFYPAGAMQKTPNASSVLASKLCLEGAVIVPNAYWFNGVGKPCWASQHKTCVAVIGGHAFYG